MPTAKTLASGVAITIGAAAGALLGLGGEAAVRLLVTDSQTTSTAALVALNCLVVPALIGTTLARKRLSGGWLASRNVTVGCWHGVSGLALASVVLVSCVLLFRVAPIAALVQSLVAHSAPAPTESTDWQRSCKWV